MKDKSNGISTQELWAKLFRSPVLERFFAENGDDCTLPSFSDYIGDLCRSREEKPAQILKRCNIERTFGHRLFSGERNPSRDTVLQLAFGFELTTDETQQLLKVARASALHPKVRRDAVIAYCIHNGRTLTDTQQCLYDNHLPLIGETQNG